MERREVKLGDIITYNKGYAFKSNEYTNTGKMVVRVTDFTLDSISDNDSVYLEPNDKYKKFIINTNDILIQTVGSWANNPNSIVGKVVRVPDKCDKAYLNQNIVRIIPNKDFDNTYLYYALKANQFSMYCVLRGQGAANQASITLDTIFKFKFRAHLLSEQKRIANILSAYDNLIENNNKRIKLLEQMAENLYKEWFVRFRFPGYEDMEFENGLPKNWVKDKIKTYYETTSGGTPKRSNSDYFESGNIPWLKTGELNDCIILDTDEHITELGLNKSSAKWLPKNSVAMAMYAGNNVGKLGYLDKEMTCSQACCVLYDKRKFSSKHYLFHYLLSIREYLQNISFGAAQQNISQDLINKVNIIMPNDEVVQLFEERINDIYNETKILLNQIKILTQQRDLLLPRLMSGKLKV